MRTISQSVLKELYKKDGGYVIPCLVEITTSNYPTIYLVNNNQSITYNSNVYLPYIFSFDFPETNSSTASITIDNIALELIELIRSAEPPIKLRIRAIYYNDENGVQIEELANWEMLVTNIVYNKMTIKVELKYILDLEKQIPLETFNPITTPAIY